MTSKEPPDDAFTREVNDLAANDWLYKLNAAGTPLAEYFNYSGVPVAFPKLGPTQRLVFDYEVDDDKTGEPQPATAVVDSYDAMCAWYTLARFSYIGVGGWRIEDIPADETSE